MEFFRIIDKQVTQETLQTSINPQILDKFTASMFFLEEKDNNFKGGTLWGEFNVSYDKIKGGIVLHC